MVTPLFRYSIHVLMYSKLGALLHRESRLSVVRTWLGCCPVTYIWDNTVIRPQWNEFILTQIQDRGVCYTLSVQESIDLDLIDKLCRSCTVYTGFSRFKQTEQRSWIDWAIYIYIYHIHIDMQKHWCIRNKAMVLQTQALTQNIMLNPNMKYLMQQLTSCPL